MSKVSKSDDCFTCALLDCLLMCQGMYSMNGKWKLRREKNAWFKFMF